MQKIDRSFTIAQGEITSTRVESCFASSSSHCESYVHGIRIQRILRTATEEFALAAKYHPHDELSAKCIRTCRHQDFPGGNFLERVESIADHNDKIQMKILLPAVQHANTPLDVVSLYGFRPKHACLWYLSPFEFTQYFYCHRLRPPGHGYSLTRLTGGVDKSEKRTSMY